MAFGSRRLITTRIQKHNPGNLGLFGNDAWPIPIKGLTLLKSGTIPLPNTVAATTGCHGHASQKNEIPQADFYVTDGKPKLPTVAGWYLFTKNSVGLDDYIVEKCYNRARTGRKLHIPINTLH